MPSVIISLSDEVYKELKKRAEKNMLNIKEQSEEILRRSMLSYKKDSTLKLAKTDDKLLYIFSREKRGRRASKR